MGYLVLQGGSEFKGRMRVSDLRAIELAGGRDAQLSIVPAAAAPDRNHRRAGENGRSWFRSLGARNIVVLPLIDRLSADDPVIASRLSRSRLIYLLGGFPQYLAAVLEGSLGWKAMCEAMGAGAVLAGSSAGAMVMGDFFYNPLDRSVVKGLGILRSTSIIPHFNAFGRQWVDRLQKELPLATLMGIDEETGIINDGSVGTWSVYGKGVVTIFRDGRQEVFGEGDRFSLIGQIGHLGMGTKEGT